MRFCDPSGREFYDNYAVFYDVTSPGVDGDAAFYARESLAARGPVLELACGTGRITFPVARSGVDIVGLDRSQAMLTIARNKLDREPPEVRQRVTLLEGDMRDFRLDRAFALIMIPYRAFLHLHAVADQRACLARVREHLAGDGKFIFNVFDPLLSVIAAHLGTLGRALKFVERTTHPLTGRPLLIWETRQYDPETQMLENLFFYEELDEQGNMVARTCSPLTLRYVHRFEMQHLLEAAGFDIQSLHGDFFGGPFRHGGEQVWTCVKAKP